MWLMRSSPFLLVIAVIAVVNTARQSRDATDSALPYRGSICWHGFRISLFPVDRDSGGESYVRIYVR